MKPVIEVIYNEYGNPIVILSKNISGLSTYDKARETRKFYTSEVKQLETMVEYIIIDVLNEFGIIPYDDSNEAFESSLQKLAQRNMKLNIIDEYKDFKGKIVHRALNQTCIEDGEELSIANKIVLEEMEK